MSLKVYEHLEQRSPEWYAARCGMVTASSVGALLSVSAPGASTYACDECGAPPRMPCTSSARKRPAPIKTMHAARTAAAEREAPAARPVITTATGDTARSLTLSLAAERITQYVEPTYTNDDMWRGIEQEPIARDRYVEVTGRAVTEVGFMVRDFGGASLGYSPDGLVGDDGLIEIKAPRQKGHMATILDGQIPARHMAQVQAGLLVSERAWCDFISWSAGMPMLTVRVLPDPRWQAAIIAAVRATERDIAEIVDRYLAAAEGLPTTERNDMEIVI